MDSLIAAAARALAAGEFSGRVELGDDLLRVTVG